MSLIYTETLLHSFILLNAAEYDNYPPVFLLQLIGRKWGRDEGREKRKNILRDTSRKRPPLYERDFKLLFLYSDDIIIIIMIKPVLIMVLTCDNSSSWMHPTAPGKNKRINNLRGRLLFLLPCLPIKLVYNGDITLPVA